MFDRPRDNLRSYSTASALLRKGVDIVVEYNLYLSKVRYARHGNSRMAAANEAFN